MCFFVTFYDFQTIEIFTNRFQNIFIPNTLNLINKKKINTKQYDLQIQSSASTINDYVTCNLH